MILGACCNNIGWDSLQKQNQKVPQNAVNVVVNYMILIDCDAI